MAEGSPSKTVLVVDDDDVLRKLVCIAMQRAGLTVTIAVDGADALQKLKSQSFDVIVSDCNMPRVDGFKLCERVRAEPGIAAIPIILMTSGTVDREERTMALRLGATAIVPRTPGLAEVMAAVRRVIAAG
jgi:CheY-like chemotaxis protein